MKTRKFEARFEGQSNAGLRARIRKVVNGARDPGAAVRALAGSVALTERGKAILEDVAQDYDEYAAEETAHGYTLAEWLEAAGRYDTTSEYDLRAAWRAGEDPADYAL